MSSVQGGNRKQTNIVEASGEEWERLPRAQCPSPVDHHDAEEWKIQGEWKVERATKPMSIDIGIPPPNQISKFILQ